MKPMTNKIKIVGTPRCSYLIAGKEYDVIDGGWSDEYSVEVIDEDGKKLLINTENWGLCHHLGPDAKAVFV